MEYLLAPSAGRIAVGHIPKNVLKSMIINELPNY
jgi:hypothetical protein